MPRQIRKKTELRDRRKEFEQQFPRKRELVFLLQDWDDGYNVGALFRSAAACGATEVIATGKTPLPPDPKIGVTSLGFHRRVHFRYFPKWVDAVGAMRNKGYRLFAVEVTDHAVHYMACDYGDKCCLVLGNEGRGLTQGIIMECDATVQIPMYGKGRSLNVATAAAIVGFEAMMRGTEIDSHER